VLTTENQPIPGATVAASPGNAILGLTSTTGELGLTAEALGTGRVAVTAEDFIASEIRLGPSLSTTVEMHLRHAETISGVVLSPGGLPLGDGVLVMAVGPLYFFDNRAVEMALAGSPLIPLVKTDKNGEFVLHGLDPGLRYRLFAAGQGHASFDQKSSFTAAPGAYVEVRALPVYGALLVFEEADGADPDLPAFEGRWHGGATPRVHADLLYSTRWTPELLGLDTGDLGARGV